MQHGYECRPTLLLTEHSTKAMPTPSTMVGGEGNSITSDVYTIFADAPSVPTPSTSTGGEGYVSPPFWLSTPQSPNAVPAPSTMVGGEGNNTTTGDYNTTADNTIALTPSSTLGGHGTATQNMLLPTTRSTTTAPTPSTIMGEGPNYLDHAIANGASRQQFQRPLPWLVERAYLFRQLHQLIRPIPCMVGLATLPTLRRPPRQRPT
jgi:hypothetical protein